jgi:predicted transcriptional regulator
MTNVYAYVDRIKSLLYAYVDRMNGNENEKNGKRIIRIDDNVVLQILSIANGGASENDIKSGIESLASDANLLEGYLEHLMNSGLIGYDDSGAKPRVYITTDNGLRFLKSYERVETGAARHEPPKGLLHID